jgi:hypothetical protein
VGDLLRLGPDEDRTEDGFNDRLSHRRGAEAAPSNEAVLGLDLHQEGLALGYQAWE